MIRKALLATTALIVAGTVAFGAQQVHKNMSAMQLEKKAEARALKRLIPGGAIPLFFNKKTVPAGFIYNNPSGTPHNNSARPLFSGTFNSFSKAKNAQFLSFYGWAAQNQNITNHGSSSSVSCYSVSSNGQCINYVVSTDSTNIVGTHSTATPITGKGQAVGTIQLGGYHFGGYGGNGKVGIYSNHTGSPCNSASSSSSAYTTTCPAGPIAGASGTFTVPSSTLCCNIGTATFTPTTLTQGTKYWVVVTGAPGTPPYNNYLAWAMEDSNYKKQPNPFVYRWQYTTKYKTTYTTTRYHGTKYHQTYHHTGHNTSGGWLEAGRFYSNGQFPADAPAVIVE